MPIIERSNNRLLPANARAADVASQAVEGIMSIQQDRTLNAFRVQGYQGILYSHLKQGKTCSCQSSNKTLNTRLGEDGKAPLGMINELLSGQMSFDVSAYGSNNKASDLNATSPSAQGVFQGVFDNVALPGTYGSQRDVLAGKSQGDNGQLNTVDIDSLIQNFDTSVLGFTDVSCAVCFGTGFIGGFSPFNTNRLVFTVTDANYITPSAIDYLAKPWSCESETFTIQTVLPQGAVSLDSFRVLYGFNTLNANFSIDNVAVTMPQQVLAFCDGKSHTIKITIVPNLNSSDEYLANPNWTHVELQFATSETSAFFEFPKLSKGSDIAQFEQLEPFQIILSPNIPSVISLDVIVESTFGKALVVQNSNWWNSRNRNVLGWECQVRAIQPTELYRILPRRGRILTKQPTTNISIDNSTGRYRT